MGRGKEKVGYAQSFAKAMRRGGHVQSTADLGGVDQAMTLQDTSVICRGNLSSKEGGALPLSEFAKSSLHKVVFGIQKRY